MLNFSFLKQRRSDVLTWAVPVGIALALHAAWILVGARAEADLDPVRSSDGDLETVADNTAQLVRITRHLSQEVTPASVDLELSDLLPPPPPPSEVLEELALPEPSPTDG